MDYLDINQDNPFLNPFEQDLIPHDHTIGRDPHIPSIAYMNLGSKSFRFLEGLDKTGDDFINIDSEFNCGEMKSIPMKEAINNLSIFFDKINLDISADGTLMIGTRIDDLYSSMLCTVSIKRKNIILHLAKLKSLSRIYGEYIIELLHRLDLSEKQNNTKEMTEVISEGNEIILERRLKEITDKYSRSVNAHRSMKYRNRKLVEKLSKKDQDLYEIKEAEDVGDTGKKFKHKYEELLKKYRNKCRTHQYLKISNINYREKIKNMERKGHKTRPLKSPSPTANTPKTPPPPYFEKCNNFLIPVKGKRKRKRGKSESFDKEEKVVKMFKRTITTTIEELVETST